MQREAEGGVYSIGAVSRMLGVPAATLRTWEERYAVVAPERSEGGHRLYSRAHVEQLRFLAIKVQEGMSAAEAHRLLAERMGEGRRVPLTQPDAQIKIVILLAERDPYAAEFSDYFLKTEGYETLVIMDGSEAEAVFAERSPDLAIIDLLLSGGAGADLCRRMKLQGSAPILAVSTLEAREEALELGADAFLRKPLEPLELISTVRDLLGTSAYLRPRVPS